MAEAKQVFKVFLSAPSDMKIYVERAKNIINDDSNKWREYELLAIEFKDLPSNITGDDPQTVINKKLHQLNIDLYIGIMGSKFGSSTPRFGSGTEEEFRLFYNKQQETGEPRISFLFCPLMKPASEVSQDEWGQWKQVEKFKEKVVQSKGIYHDFFSTSDFDKFLHNVLYEFKSDFYSQIRFDTHSKEADSTNTIFQVNKAFFTEWLDHPGQTLSNGHTSTISLSELFVAPRFVKRSLINNNDEDFEGVSRPFDLNPNYSQLPKKLLLVGDEGIGKSSVLKRAFNISYDAGMVPLVLRCENISPGKYKNIDRLFRPSIKQQYFVEETVTLNNIPKPKRVALIDNFDLIKLNSEGKENFITQIQEEFDNIFITVSGDFATTEFSISSSVFQQFSQFECWEIQEFNDRQVNNIITNWVRAGQRYEIDEVEEGIKINRLFPIVRDIVGHNYVSRSPFVILVILTGLSTGMDATELKNPSFARYYRFLLDKHIFSEFPRDLIELAYSVFPFIAQRIFESENKELSIEEMDHAVLDFHNDIGPPIDMIKRVIQAAIKGRIIVFVEDGYHFRDNYAYYYFLTDYWSENISDEKIVDQIKGLSESLYLKESASILIFLASQKRHQLVINTLLTQLSSSISEQEEFEFGKGAANKMNQLIDEAPKLFLTHKGSERQRIIQAEEKRDRTLSIDVTAPEEEGFDESDFFQHLIIATRRIEIVGQLLKCHANKIHIDTKVDLFEQSVKSGLRLTNGLFVQIFSEPEELVSYLRTQLKNKFEEKDIRQWTH